ncbi:MAG: peptidoglycan DD-metalloendopeptidase family protein [Deltaproteobacteria bacterium]|nr:peptidoglycan DD-metalloendopeptidase family protein [Deltaproteobacteria bacterium]
MIETNAVNNIARAAAGVAPDNPDKAALKKAAEEFEAFFINEMLKSMRATIQKSSLFDGGNAQDLYSSMMDTELSRFMASSGGIGLGSILLQQILPDEGAAVAVPSDKPPLKNGVLPYHMIPSEDGKDAWERTAPLKFPVKGIISSGFGLRADPFTGEEGFHHGVDIAAKEGAPIYPAAKGMVIFSGYKEGFGNVVEVEHEGGQITRYGHNMKNLVNQGDAVKTSEPIAYVGKTGRATGPHLHFEVISEGGRIDPSGLNYG